MTADHEGDLWHQLWQRECDYWADVDLDAGRGAPEYYTADAVFDQGTGSPLIGRPDIASFYRRRQSNGPRTSAHIVHNFVIVDSHSDTAQTRGYVTLHAETGAPPIPNTTPGLVAVVSTMWQRTSDRWLISQRTSQALFSDPDHVGPTASAPPTEGTTS